MFYSGEKIRYMGYSGSFSKVDVGVRRLFYLKGGDQICAVSVFIFNSSSEGIGFKYFSGI